MYLYCVADSGFHTQPLNHNNKLPKKQQIKNNDRVSMASQNFSQAFILEDLKRLMWESKKKK